MFRRHDVRSCRDLNFREVRNSFAWPQHQSWSRCSPCLAAVAEDARMHDGAYVRLSAFSSCAVLHRRIRTLC